MQISRSKSQFTLIGIALTIAFHCSTGLAKNSSEVKRSCSELLKRMGTASHSFYSEAAVNDSPLVKTLNTIFKNRSVVQQRKINAALTALHAQNEMTFQTKNPKTGFYDKFTAVPVNGIVAPISERKFNGLVQSTGPLMRFLRSLLQHVYSTNELTAASLGLTSLNPAEAARAIQVIKESIYLEPALRSPAMKEYPFLSVGGFDGAIGDPSHPEPIFYEMNLGTPSGISNNTYLSSYLATVDPEVFEALEPSLKENNTFQVLRKAIESNALAWTKNPAGISVVISPGVYNGAHPDVAAIAKYASMPLVHASDLYEDADGNIRINMGKEWRHEIVTGIYGRTEESYFFQSNDEKIPMVAPFYVEVNQNLSAKLNLQLRPGAIYSYIKDDAGNIIDVERDEHNQPLLQQVWDTIGQDPYRPEAPRGSFAKAVLNRKLYFSGLGGRVVDDKRLFRIFSQLFEGQNVARPVQGLDPNHLEAFFANPLQYFVKEPSNSGGVGVYPMAMVDEKTRDQVIARVRANPFDFEIQNIREVTTLPTVDDHTKSDAATDLRLFVTIDSEGTVDAGTQSVLLRTAKNGSLFTNTSQGGGYGIAVVYKDDSKFTDKIVKFFAHTENSLPVIRDFTITTDPFIDVLVGTVKESIQLALATQTDKELTADEFKELQNRAENLSYQIREVLNLLPGDASLLASACRDFAQAKKLTAPVRDRFHARLLLYLSVIDVSVPNVTFAVQKAVQAELRNSKNDLLTLGLYSSTSDIETEFIAGMRTKQARPSDSSLVNKDSNFVIRKYKTPEIVFTYDEKVGNHVKAEVAEYLQVDNPEMQKLIDEVHAAGGEVRMVKTLKRYSKNAKWTIDNGRPYFWVNKNNLPIIGIDLDRDYMVLAMFEHEMGHFRYWKSKYDKFRAEGFNHIDACRLAGDEINQLSNWVESEHIAVTAEMKSEVEQANNPFNKPGGHYRALHFYDPAYANRITYPQFEGVRLALYYAMGANAKPLPKELVKQWLTEMIQTAQSNRKKAIEFLSNPANYSEQLPENKAKMYLRDFHTLTLEHIIMRPHGPERLIAEKTYDQFFELLRETASELKVDILSPVGESAATP